MNGSKLPPPDFGSEDEDLDVFKVAGIVMLGKDGPNVGSDSLGAFVDEPSSIFTFDLSMLRKRAARLFLSICFSLFSSSLAAVANFAVRAESDVFDVSSASRGLILFL